MTTKPPSTEPLDEQEHELARIVRALAGGEPPAALDARILKAAANATAAQEPRRMRWPVPPKMFWSLGSAAAAVLAVGIGWQMTRPMPHSLSVPVPGTPQMQAVETPETQQSMQPSSIEQSSARQSNAPAPSNDMAAREPGNPPPLAARPSEPESRQRSPGKTESEISQPPAAPIIAPVAPPPAPEAFAQKSRDEQGAVAARSSASSETHADQPAVAGNVAAMAKAAPMQAAAAEAIAADTSAERTQSFRHAPSDWLEHIRQLNQQGRADEARTSLAEFRRQYPRHEIPADLAALLHE